jgi:hypothetical protein
MTDKPTARERLERRFWAKVDRSDPDGCWPWIGFRRKAGYGCFFALGQSRQATHVALWLTTGEWLPKGIFACHHCDNPSCVNPAHLFLGTAADNARDCLEKGRDVNPQGERNGSAKLTEDDVRAILAAPESQRQLAAKYGVTQQLIGLIRTRKIWRHVTEEVNA